MELSKQIKEHRARLEISQEQLAEKMYVSRQTISNWETERSYPDVHNLLLLSTIFDVTLDQLVKGDVKIMKEKISKSNINKDTNGMLIFSVLAAVSTGFLIPIINNLFSWPMLIPIVFWLMAMYYAMKIEKWKKNDDIKTYKEIAAFMDGRDVDVVRKQRNKKKDFGTKTLIVITFSLAVGIITLIVLFITQGLVDYFK
ncbi:helix-turn-helix transcriptional regulator [Floricoccus penangensis]|uniref:helix-turn-helix transcriptional regulator n=1 Tax=Floricoccus penangensis TaxID=1859475 RepID=UPI00203D8C77|nr:helix-turn-helix transcriptional regulator [Floricoccus penangensis]URZ87582.1 helix-turn-helix domain-containing protein [Floricoccus penangensis]